MRPDWDAYFLEIAATVSTRATCDRKHVGCVLVKGNAIAATGYNGSMSGLGHCDDIGHLMEDGHCVRTIHAEANAVAQAAKNGVSLDNAVAFINAAPCWNCFRLLVNAGIRRIIFNDAYRLDSKVIDAAEKAGVVLVDLSVKKP